LASIKAIYKYVQTKIILIEKTYALGLVQALYILFFHFMFYMLLYKNGPVLYGLFLTLLKLLLTLQDTHLLLTGGMEKILRVYDMNRPDAAPRELDKSPGSVRTAAWLHSDQTILSSCTDMGGVRCVHGRNASINDKHLYWLAYIFTYYSCIPINSILWYRAGCGM
jgi:hypothetical protein